MAARCSQQSLTQGDGFVEFTVGESNTLWAAGFSHGNTDTTYAGIDFAFRFNGGGWADVIENGIYQNGGDTPYAPGDVFRVAVVGGKIQYSRNGVVLHDSQTAPQYPLVLDASLATIGATIVNATDRRARPTASLWWLPRKGRIADVSRTVHPRSDSGLPSRERGEGSVQVSRSLRHHSRAIDECETTAAAPTAWRTSAIRTGGIPTTTSAGLRC